MAVVDNMELAPSVCFICEMRPVDTPAVDTFRTFEPPRPSPLDGRKYVCAHCVTSNARELGWSSPEEVEQLTAELERVTGHLSVAESRAFKRDRFADAWDDIRSDLEELVAAKHSAKQLAKK